MNDLFILTIIEEGMKVVGYFIQCTNFFRIHCVLISFISTCVVEERRAKLFPDDFFANMARICEKKPTQIAKQRSHIEGLFSKFRKKFGIQNYTKIISH